MPLNQIFRGRPWRGNTFIRKRATGVAGNPFLWDFSNGGMFTDVGGAVAASSGQDVAALKSATGLLLTQGTPGFRAQATADGVTFGGDDYYQGSGAGLASLFNRIGDNSSAWEARVVFKLSNVATNQTIFSLFNTGGVSNIYEIMYLRIQSNGEVRFIYEDDASSAKNITTTGETLSVDTLYAAEIVKDGEDVTLSIYEAGEGLIITKDGTFNNGDFSPNLLTIGALGRATVSQELVSGAEIHDFEVFLP